MFRYLHTYLIASLLVSLELLIALPCSGEEPLVYSGGSGPGEGKHIVFIAAEQSYRSEVSMPQLARILARQGFRCTVLFAIDVESGVIDPRIKDNIPGLDSLRDADLLIAFLRWRELPDEQMKEIIDYTESGRPIIGIRNATHAFRYPEQSGSVYAKYDSRSTDPKGGWGRMVLGETWVTHYGTNLVESTRCDVVRESRDHPIFRGVSKSFWLADDVYGISSQLEGDSQPLLMGQPLKGWGQSEQPNLNKPPVPIAWTKSYTGSAGISARIFTTTMGHADAFRNADFRRMLFNASFWCLKMERDIDPLADVALSGSYSPGPAGINGLRLGLRPDAPELTSFDPSPDAMSSIRAAIDDTLPGWESLTEKDFAQVNSHDDTWRWENGKLLCTGQPVSVLRTAEQYENFEMVVEWMHEKSAGNSGVFVWVTPESIEKLTDAGKPGLPSGIEVQILDHGYTDMLKQRGQNTDWFGTNGDVFAVGVEMTPFPPLSPNGTRSFPRKHLSNGHGQWNHYYIRAINGEVRLWVNGEEVSGGTDCNPAAGFLCLESEGSPIQFRRLRIRKLP